MRVPFSWSRSRSDRLLLRSTTCILAENQTSPEARSAGRMRQELWQKCRFCHLCFPHTCANRPKNPQHEDTTIYGGATSLVLQAVASPIKRSYWLLDDFNHGAKTTGIKTDNKEFANYKVARFRALL